MSTHYTIFTGKTKKIRATTTAPTDPVQGEVYLLTATGSVMLVIFQGNNWAYLSTTNA